MMKKSIAILTVAMFMLAPVMFAEADLDADDPLSKTSRTCNDNLYHSVATALADDGVKSRGLWVYPLGEDESMKAYIADPQKASRPANGLSEVKEGVQYDIYYFYSPGWPFEDTPSELALSSYAEKIYVEDKTVMKLKVTSVKDDNRTYDYYRIKYKSDTTELTQYLDVGDTASLNHYKDGGYYSFDNYNNETLYTEYTYETTVKEFTGSPYLYIGLCIGITAAIALLIFWCGRKPKL